MDDAKVLKRKNCLSQLQNCKIVTDLDVWIIRLAWPVIMIQETEVEKERSAIASLSVIESLKQRRQEKN
jgi:hypothetical protein